MAFLRIKKIKGKEYAYMVENEWKPTAKSIGTLRDVKLRGSRQKVKGYIGRIHRFSLTNNIDFQQFMKITNVENYINSNDKNKIISDLAEWELFKFGVSKEEFSIAPSIAIVKKSKKNVALHINNGFMCNLTMKNLLEIEPTGDEQHDGYLLARAFVEAGIKVPEEIFVGVFGKLYKN